MLFFYTHTYICIINIRQTDQAMTFYKKNCDVFCFNSQDYFRVSYLGTENLYFKIEYLNSSIEVFSN